jgi:hypothetical protein
MAKNSSVSCRNCPQYLVSYAGIYLLDRFKLRASDASRTFCNRINTPMTGSFSNLRVTHSMCYYTDARCTINSFEYKCARENLHPLHLTTLIPSLRIEGGEGGVWKKNSLYFLSFKLTFHNKNYSIFQYFPNLKFKIAK